MTRATLPQYRRAKTGEWVVFGPADSVRVGQVTVAKRDGAAKDETITRVGKTFQVDGVPCVYGYIAQRNGGAVAARNRTHYAGSGRCRTRGCGYPAGASGYCRQCEFDEYDQ